MKQIASPHNAQIKRLAKLLAQTRARRAEGAAVLEGVHLLQSCLQAGGVPEQVFVPRAKLQDGETAVVCASLPDRLLTVVDDGILSKISSLAKADDIAALIRLPSEKPLPQTGDCVVLEAVQDPGNVGTVMRSAAAAGVKHLITDAFCADVWSPKVLRAAMGAHFLLDMHSGADLAQWRAGFRDKVCATALGRTNSTSLYRMDLRAPAAWIFGNEGSGVGGGLLETADCCAVVPMAGATESLNVAMAATVCLFEQLRQRLDAV